MWEVCFSSGASASRPSPQAEPGEMLGGGLSLFKPLPRVAETQPNAEEAEWVGRGELEGQETILRCLWDNVPTRHSQATLRAEPPVSW